MNEEIRRAILRARRITREVLSEVRGGERPAGWTDAHERALRRILRKNTILRILGRPRSRSEVWDEIADAYRRIADA